MNLVCGICFNRGGTTSLAKAGAATAALFLTVQPCLAADTANSSNTYENRKAAFAGLQVRL